MRNPADVAVLEKAFLQIGSFLKWNLVDEKTDEGEEKVILFEPGDTTDTPK